MERTDVSHPHDLFARNILGDTELAADLLRNYLPPEWGTALDWDGLKREGGDTVAPDLSKLVGDLRYSARFRGSGEALEVFICLEHQSRSDRLMSFRMLEYIFAAYRQRVPGLGKGKRFPYPLAVVLYHGKTPWKKIPPMRDLISIPPGMADDILRLPIFLIDLAATPADRLRGHPMVCALLDSLQSASAGVFRTRLRGIADRLRGLAGERRMKQWAEALSTYYYTLVHGETREAADELMRAFTGVYGKRGAREMAMTVAEKLQREGRLEGKAEGRAEGKAEGRAEGKVEGRLEGRAEGKIESVITVLESRLGEIPIDLYKKLMCLRDDGRIEKRLKLAATCRDFKEFQKTLERRANV